MDAGELNAGGNPAMDWHSVNGGPEIFLVASCYRNRDKLWLDGPLSWYVDFTFTYQLKQIVLIKQSSISMELCSRSRDSFEREFDKLISRHH